MPTLVIAIAIAFSTCAIAESPGRQSAKSLKSFMSEKRKRFPPSLPRNLTLQERRLLLLYTVLEEQVEDLMLQYGISAEEREFVLLYWSTLEPVQEILFKTNSPLKHHFKAVRDDLAKLDGHFERSWLIERDDRPLLQIKAYHYLLSKLGETAQAIRKRISEERGDHLKALLDAHLGIGLTYLLFNRKLLRYAELTAHELSLINGFGVRRLMDNGFSAPRAVRAIFFSNTRHRLGEAPRFSKIRSSLREVSHLVSFLVFERRELFREIFFERGLTQCEKMVIVSERCAQEVCT